MQLICCEEHMAESQTTVYFCAHPLCALGACFTEPAKLKKKPAEQANSLRVHRQRRASSSARSIIDPFVLSKTDPHQEHDLPLGKTFSSAPKACLVLPWARFCLSAFESIQFRLWFASRRTLASGQGARRPVRRPIEQTRGSVLPNKPGSILQRADAERDWAR